MRVNKLTDDFGVMGQLSPADVAKAKELGFKAIVCNRPDGEQADQPTAAEVRAATEAVGLDFHFNPIASGDPTPDAVRKQAEAIKGTAGPVLAYCGSGKRATALWMLADPHDLSAEERIERAADAGYDLAMLRHRL